MGLSINKIIEFYRVKDWLHILGLILLGFVSPEPAKINFQNLLVALLVGSLYLAHGYSLNDFFDKQIRIKISRRKALQLCLLPLVLCLIVSCFISSKALYIVAFGHLCGMFYSAAPFKFKNKVFLDLIFNALSLAPLFLLGAIAVKKNFSSQALLLAFLFFLYFIPIQLIHQIQDYFSDRQSHQKNTVQILGIENSTYLIFVFLVFYVFFSSILWKWQIFKICPWLLSCLFSLVLIFYLSYNRPARILLQPGKAIKFKLAARYISIIYGIGLLTAFYFNF